MAQRRMFSKNVARTDQFLDMSQSAQNLYFHLGLEADDDGFVSPKMIMRMLGSTQDDFTMLVIRGFIIPFQSGVIVIRHWKINNELKSDRYKPSIRMERKQILIDNDNVYQHEDEYDPNGTQQEVNELKRLQDKSVPKLDTKWKQNVSVGKDSIGKVSIVKDSKETNNEYSDKTLEVCKVLQIEPTKSIQIYVDTYRNIDLVDYACKVVEWCRNKPDKVPSLTWMNWVRRDAKKETKGKAIQL